MKAFRSYFTPTSRGGDVSGPKPVESKKPEGGRGSDKPVTPGPATTRRPQAHRHSSITFNISRPESTRSGMSDPSREAPTQRQSLLDMKNDMMVTWMYQQQMQRRYTSGVDPTEGVILKKERGNFTCCPPHLASIPGGLYQMVVNMNVRCAMTINTPFVHAIITSLRDDRDHVPLPDGLRVQVLRTISDLPNGSKHHFAAFIRDQGILVVWDDSGELVLRRAELLQAKLVEAIWGNGQEEEEVDEKKDATTANVVEVDEGSLEDGSVEKRPIMLQNPIMVGATMALCITCLGLGWRWLAYEIAVVGGYQRLALLVVSPLQVFCSIFLFQTIIGNLMQCFGPITMVWQNSKFYSGKPPRRLNRDSQTLPHITIQMPVYKEGLQGVIQPTVESVNAAISTYVMQGGSANIFINDDGMQLVPEEEAQARRDFYDEHNIGWVARPGHNPKPADGARPFLRRGKFKKASNMNYALHVANRVEEKLGAVDRSQRWSNEDEAKAYEQCLAAALEEDEGRTWADGNIRVGDYILLIDSDTRVPRDCLLDAASEMEQSPEVAIIQFSSGVMNVTNSYFENGVTWFTNLIYSAITFTVATGDACPFVGHNAILRWSALQDAASFQDEDGYDKYWSESHVSEDFDMALRLQVAGYTLRYAAYTGEGFKEGVSLTVYDELARWEKYAYGCNELLFHPLRYWFTRGPVTKLFRQFLTSSIPLHKKITICGYIGTYYAIASAWLLTLGNFFLTGWFYGLYDKYYLDSFAIYLSIVVVFSGFGNVALAGLRYRLHQKTLLGALFENIKWIPLWTIFLGGISMHVSQAILSHFFSIDMVWGATAKEYEEVIFTQEIVRIFRKFKWTFLFCLTAAATMICAAFVFPHNWRISTFASYWPLATVVVSHFALPVFLNPALMMFTW